MATIGTLGTDPDYASLLAGRQNPRLLMAQKLMDLGAAPATNSTQSSFWANLLNQGARGALGGYLYGDEMKREGDEAEKQKTEADAFFAKAKKLQDGFSEPVKGGTAPAAPAPAPAQGGGPRASLGAGALPPEQRQAILASATSGTMVPPHVLDALITQESGWRPGAQGKGSDLGLGQVTASTAASPGYGLPPLSDADRLDPNKNAAWSARYLEARGKAAGLARPEDWNDPAKLALALKAYNGGGDPNYVANVTRHMVGKQADASPAPGSNLDALRAGMDAPKPRGVQLAENLLPGTATDAPTAILPNMGDAQGTAAPRVPVASAALDAPGAAAPAMPSPAAASVSGANLELPAPPDAAAVPLPPPAVAPLPDAATTPPIAAAVPPRADVPVVPAPDAASVPAPALGGAVPTPAVVPQPDAAIASPPPTPALVPDNPMANADPASLAAFNGLPQPTPAVVPPPAAAAPPPQPVPDGGASRPDLPIPVPPIPPGQQLAQPLVQPPQQAPGAAPPAGPTGPQLAAPLMSWAGELTPEGAPLLRPAGGPSGTALAAPLVTPAAGPGDAAGSPTADTSAAGGPNKGAPSSSAGLQDRADQLAALAQEAAGSSNPRIRAYAGVLQAQSAALQHRIERQDTLDQRREAQADRSADRSAAAADRAADRRTAQETALANRPPVTREVTGDDGKVHYQEFDYGTRTWKDTGMLGPKQPGAGGGPYAGKGIQAEDSNMVLTLGPKVANGTATDAEHATYSMAFNRLRDGPLEDMPDPHNPNNKIKVRLPGQDMSGFPLPRGGTAAADPNAPKPIPGSSQRGADPPADERNAAGFASRMEQADKIMGQVGDPSWADMMAGRAGVVGNYLTSPKGQQFQQAAQAWIRAKLRKESGAAIGKDEMEQEFQTYFPQPGDSPEKLRQKQEFRERETAAMRTSAGRAYTAPDPASGGTPLPPDKGQLQSGTVYTLRDGRRGKWNGSAFEVQ
jgi:soluble lytic murein transglycosylase-like protein